MYEEISKNRHSRFVGLNAASIVRFRLLHQLFMLFEQFMELPSDELTERAVVEVEPPYL